MGDPFFIWLFLTLSFDLFAWLKPFGTRIFLGLFFIVMALGVNLVIALTNPQLLTALGANSLIPFYRWAFQHWVAAEPLAFIIPIILFELIAGFLMLGKGVSAKWGLVGAMVFLVMTAPLHEVTLPNLVLAIGVWFLLRRDLGRSLRDTVRKRRERHHSPMPTSPYL